MGDAPAAREKLESSILELQTKLARLAALLESRVSRNETLGKEVMDLRRQAGPRAASAASKSSKNMLAGLR